MARDFLKTLTLCAPAHFRSRSFRTEVGWWSPSLTLRGCDFFGHRDSIPVTNGNGLSKTERKLVFTTGRCPALRARKNGGTRSFK
jgi:hypothetical protein